MHGLSATGFPEQQRQADPPSSSPAEKVQPKDALLADADCSATHHRILVIDDNRAIHDDFRKILVSSNARKTLADAEAAFFGKVAHQGVQLKCGVDSAYQGREGLDKVVAAVKENRPYDLAFVDMRMPPGWDGLTTIEHLWQVDPNLQVVVCTAYSDDSWSDICRRLGQTDRLLILKKPFDNVEVLQLTAALTEKRRLARRVATKVDELETLVSERTANLKEAREESERLLASISSLVIGIDQAGVIRRWNGTSENVLGISASDAIGKPLTSLNINWHDAAKLSSMTGNRSRKQQRFEMAFSGDDDTGRVLELIAYPIVHGTEHQGVLILGTDHTERRSLEQQLHQAQKLESVGQLAAGVAHEINTPMQYIGDNIQYLKASWKRLSPLLECVASLEDGQTTDAEQGILTEKLDAIRARLQSVKLDKLLKMAPEALDDAEEGVQHVSRIVRAMKEFSHPGNDERSPVDLNHALESTVVVAKNEWKYVAEVELDLDPALPLVFGFGGELNQVFLNLTVNAAHAISSVTNDGANGKGRIRISTRHQGDTCTVRISDTGCGIPTEIQHKIFDPFFTTKDVGKGTGQGLAIAYQVVVNQHNGKIWFETERGVGTTFVVELPAEERGDLP